MSTLEDFQFELDGYVFGNGLPIFVDEDGFDPGDMDWAVQDTQNAINGSTMFGRDVTTASTWTFALHTNTETPEDALAELDAMGAVWLQEQEDSRAVNALRYCLGGRTRVVYGRPRKFTYKMNNRFLSGYVPPMATFVRADSLHYDDTPKQLDLKIAPSIAGGFVFPTAWPITFDRPADFVNPSAVVVGGTGKTAPIVTFYGPVTNPSIQIGDFLLALDGSIGEGGSVEVDMRPWAQTVKRRGNAAAVRLGRDVRLARGRLAPGSYDALFRGTDTTGMARCRVVWRDAWKTI